MNVRADGTAWSEQNQQYLVARLHAVQRVIQSDETQTGAIDFSKSERISDTMERPPALVSLATIFSLSEFEQFVLLVCAGYEMDSPFAQAVKTTPNMRPCFELLLSLFPAAHWSAITPVAPLRHWRLIELKPGESLISSPLQIDEHIVHYLSGLSYLDSRLTGLVELGKPSPVLTPLLEDCAAQLEAHWKIQGCSGQPLLAQLCGSCKVDMNAVASHACEQLDFITYTLNAENVPSDLGEQKALSILWQREALLHHAVLIINVDDKHQETVSCFVNKLLMPCIVVTRQPLKLNSELVIRIDMPQTNSSEQLALWRSALGDSARHINGGLDRIVSQFSFSAQDIASLSQNTLSVDDHSNVEQLLWEQCRSRSRRQLEGLAERIESAHQWDDLVLPATQKEALRDIVAYARHRHRVYGDWKFGAKSKRGQGGSCLFYGPSGTGKTMAASVIANELQLDLYHVDLSQVINKYIGETEKNVARIFDMAENSGAILLFDEADSLFAKRTEVKTSNDRNANIGTSYLLQRMENYSGLAILTTNLKKEMDSAFMRRIRFATQFPFPDQITRQQIWGGMFPAESPVSRVDMAKLSGLDLAGGSIHNIVLNAAFYAAEEKTAISMSHLAKAARREYSKLEKPIKENELRAWV